MPFSLAAPTGTAPIVVVERRGAKLLVGDRSQPSNPGLAIVRLKRLAVQSEPDRMLAACRIDAGDVAIDGTFGFGQDALLLAHAVGASGRVVGFESSPVLTALALAGMPGWPEPASALVGRISLTCADHRTALAALPDRSADVVFLDPMFHKARGSQPGFDVLRDVAEHAPLSAEALAEAVRVARKRVVVKDGADGITLMRLRIPPFKQHKWARVHYGVIERG